MIDANTYHRLSFTLDYDHHELMIGEAISNFWGGVARVAWAASDGTGFTPFTITQDIVVVDGGPTRYQMDLAAFTNTTTLEAPIASLWQGGIGTFRIDVNESEAARAFRLSNVKLAADDAPNGSGFFPIRWRIADATFTAGVADSGGADATVALYYDTDLDPATEDADRLGRQRRERPLLLEHGRPRARRLLRLRRSHRWHRQLAGPLLDRPGPRQRGDPGRRPTTTATASRMRGRPGTACRTRARTTTATASPTWPSTSAGTHPRLSNTWTLPEGATGFFAERLALANPDSTPADVTLTFLRPAPSTPITRTYSLLPYGRTTVDVNAIAGLGQADVSTVITANTGGVVAERTMFWGDQFYGGHTGKAIERTGTHVVPRRGRRQQLLHDLHPAGQPRQHAGNGDGDVPARAVGHGHQELQRAGQLAGDHLHERGPGRRRRPAAERPLVLDAGDERPRRSRVERSMYFTNSRVWNGGHEAAAVPAPRTNWYVAEGATGSFFSDVPAARQPERRRRRPRRSATCCRAARS